MTLSELTGIPQPIIYLIIFASYTYIIYKIKGYL
jgi:hypothetical protein